MIWALRRLKVASSFQLGLYLNLNHRWVDQKLRILKLAGRIYISDWMKHAVTGGYRAYYSLRTSDMENDEPKPKAKSPAERSRDYQRRKSFAVKLNIGVVHE